eukprot:gene36202-40953_t
MNRSLSISSQEISTVAATPSIQGSNDMTHDNPNRLPTYFISHGGGPWPWMPEMAPAMQPLAESLAGIAQHLSQPISAYQRYKLMASLIVPRPIALVTTLS